MSTSLIDGGHGVHETVQRHPETLSVFNAFGIHTCCGSTASIVEAAHRDGADADALLDALRQAVSQPAAR